MGMLFCRLSNPNSTYKEGNKKYINTDRETPRGTAPTADRMF